MATLEQIANQVNNTLSDIKTNTQETADTAALIKGDTADVKTRLDNLIAVDQNGFATLATGLAVMIDRQEIANNLLDFNRQQNDTIICWLTDIADVLCRLLQRANTSISIQKATEESVRQLREVDELVHGAETVSVLKRHELQTRLDECCPPDPETPEHCYDGCETPKYVERPPREKDFHPPREEEKTEKETKKPR